MPFDLLLFMLTWPHSQTTFLGLAGHILPENSDRGTLYLALLEESVRSEEGLRFIILKRVERLPFEAVIAKSASSPQLE